jgi:PPOX class probable FMN-dependent enzyme
MALAPWRSAIARALHRNRSLVYARYLQLATVRPDGSPANRTVVFRSFLEETDQLQFVTDARSEKVADIAHHPWGEACWYFPNTREQFRLTGSLILVSETHLDPSLQQARQRSWQALSDSARTQFTWPHPGESRSDDGFDAPPPDPTTPLSHFCLLLLQPHQVDHLELRGEPQNRYLYRLSEAMEWSIQTINP